MGIPLQNQNEEVVDIFFDFLIKENCFNLFIKRATSNFFSVTSSFYPIYWIKYAFIAENTPEGKDFWEDVNKKWKKEFFKYDIQRIHYSSFL